MVVMLQLAALAIAAAQAAPTKEAPGLPTKRFLPLEVAKAAANAAVGQCAANGFSISVAVLDRSGGMIVYLRGDNAKPHHAGSARRKAYTALTFQMPSSQVAAFVASHPAAAGLLSMDGVIALGGGLPIKVGGDVVGAIGVAGGAKNGDDEPCAQAGIDAIAQFLR